MNGMGDQELEKTMRALCGLGKMIRDLRNLRAVNAQLVAACEALVEAYSFEIAPSESEVLDQAQAALKAAEEGE